jgi:hypothetical protein
MQIATLLRYYPPAWRARYEDEVTDVLEQHRVSYATWLDLARGAFDAHLDPRFSGAIGTAGRRLRRAEIAVFCAFIAFVVAGIGFQKLTEDADKAGLMQAHAAIGLGYYAVIVGAVVALLAIIAGALPIAAISARQAFSGGRRDLLALLAVPPLLFIVFVVWGAADLRSSSTIDSADVRGLIGFFVLAAIASAAAVSLAVARTDLNDVVLGLARWPSIIATAAMGLSLTGVVVWGIGLHAAAPSAFALNGGVLISYAYVTFLRVVIVMALALLVALVALWRAQGATPANLDTAAH